MSKMKKISLIAFCLTPMIIYQWYRYFSWLRQFEELRIFSYTFLIGLLYFVAYYFVYKEKYKIALYSMWGIYILHVLIQLSFWIYIIPILLSFDLWINITLTIAISLYRNKSE